MSFPILEATPTYISAKSDFNTISIEYDGGYEQTRERHTRDRKSFKVSYTLLTRADKNLVESHYNTVKGSESFAWQNIDTLTTYTVRYTKAPEFVANAQRPNRFDINLEMRTV